MQTVLSFLYFAEISLRCVAKFPVEHLWLLQLGPGVEQWGFGIFWNFFSDLVFIHGCRIDELLYNYVVFLSLCFYPQYGRIKHEWAVDIDEFM